MAWSRQINLKHDPLYHIHWSPSLSLHSNQYWWYWYYSASMPLETFSKEEENDRKDSTTNNRMKKNDVRYSQNICSIFGREKEWIGHMVCNVMIREYHRVKVGNTGIKEYTIFWQSCNPIAVLYESVERWGGLELIQQLKASSKEDSLVLFFNPYQHPTMGCRKLGSSYDSYQGRNLDQF